MGKLGKATPGGQELCCLGVLCVELSGFNRGAVVESGLEPNSLRWEGESCFTEEST